ncbi:MAG: response regulator [Myxococcaceae bacterium]
MPGPTLLLVDDEPNNRLVFRLALADAFEVLVAKDAEEALELVGEREVDIVFTDHRMPGMSGVELCERLRHLRPSVPRVLLTAHPQDGAVRQALSDGRVMELMAKPWEREQVVEVVAKLLRRVASGS